ncbi:MAG: hypothetical protein ACI3YK_05805 [Eubacteriales bacterium]
MLNPHFPFAVRQIFHRQNTLAGSNPHQHFTPASFWLHLARYVRQNDSLDEYSTKVREKTEISRDFYGFFVPYFFRISIDPFSIFFRIEGFEPAKVVEIFKNLWYNYKNNTLEQNMVYKNGLKEYSLTTILFGVPMGILFGLSKLSFIVGVISGVFSGLLFTFLMFVFIKIQEKKFDKKRIEIAKERRIICDGGATINGNGGWMFLTEIGIEFYPHKINVSTEEIKIPTSMIEAVKTQKIKL